MSQRIAIVSRRFWPICGPTEHFVADLADEISKAGHEVQLFTAAWQKDWPTDCTFREFSIRRISRPASGPWGTYRYQKALVKSLLDFQPDAVLMFGNGEDVGPVRKTIGDNVPCVLRVDHRAVALMNRTAQKNARLDLASSILCDSLRTRNELVSRKIVLPADVQIVQDGVTLPTSNHERTLVRQANSRALLGDAHPILRIESAQPLVVTGAPMNGEGGICDLIRAWQVVLESFPRGKLWILGDGPRARKVWDAISDLDMVYSAIMTGYFDDLGEIFQAADLYVHPMRTAINCQCLFSAIAHQVCPLTVTSSHEPIPIRGTDGSKVGSTVHVQKDQTGIIAPAGNPVALGEAITMALHNSETRRQLGAAAAEQFGPAIDIERIGKVFRSVLLGIPQIQNASGVSSL